MENKELVELTESIKEEIYAICNREVSKITADFKTKLRLLIDERTKRNELLIGRISWGCPTCIVGILQLYIRPWMESARYQKLKDSIQPPTVVPLKMVPDAGIDITTAPFNASVEPVKDVKAIEPIKRGRKKK